MSAEKTPAGAQRHPAREHPLRNLPGRRPAGRIGMAILLALAAGACGGDSPAAPITDQLPIRWTFDTGIQGWDLNAAVLQDGIVEMQAAGDPDFYDMTISRRVVIPAGASTIAVRVMECSAHGDTDVRIRAITTGETILRDWTEVSNTWTTVTAPIGDLAGEDAAIYVDQNDNGEQETSDDPELLCVDEVSIQ